MTLRIPKRTRSARVSSHRIFDVYEHDMEIDNPEAGLQRFSVVTLEMADWVTVVALTADQQVLLIRQHRYGAAAVMLETPGGIIDGDESPEDAAARELREETGYVPDAIESMGWVHPNPAIQGNRIHLMLARGVRDGGVLDLDEHESTESLILSRDEVVQGLSSGRIRHALSALALERALSRFF